MSQTGREVMAFFQKGVPWIFSGMGGYNMNAVKDAFEIYEVPQTQRALLMDYITIIISAHATTKTEEKS